MLDNQVNLLYSVHMVSRQRQWQLAQLKKGRCSICGKKRGKTISERCGVCRKKNIARIMARYHAEQAELKRYREGQS